MQDIRGGDVVSLPSVFGVVSIPSCRFMYLGSSFFVLTQVLQYRCTVHPRLNAFNEDSNLNQGYMKPRIRRLKYKHLHLGTEMGDFLPAIELGEGRTAHNLTVGASHTCVVLVRHPIPKSHLFGGLVWTSGLLRGISIGDSNGL